MTAVAVDLAAVARARAELAALVVAHPSLTSPEAHARLAAALPDLVEPSMPPRLDPESADTTIVGVRMTDEMLRALDAEVARQRAANPDVSIGRSNVLRGIVRRALLNPSPSTVEAAPVPAEPAQVRRPTLPPARASVRPPLPSVPPPRVPAELVETEAARVDPRQLALIPEPPVDLDGMTVRETPLETVAEVRARLLALRAADPKAWSYRKVAALAHMSPEPIASVVNGENVRPETLARIAAILPRE